MFNASRQVELLGFHCAAVRKKKLILAVIQRLRSDLALYHRAAVAARAEATHEQSKPENKYDTRGLEASYLARGQSRQVAEIETAIEQFEKTEVLVITPESPLGAQLIGKKQGEKHKLQIAGSSQEIAISAIW